MLRNLEIERKFLIHKLPPFIRQCPHRKIVQGYILCKDESVDIRLRRDGDRFIHTVKRGSGIERIEVNLQISESQFLAIWPLTEGSRIEKTRFLFESEGGNIEVDIYEGPARGLITADVEFFSIEEAERFVPPDWFGDDITMNAEYRNRHLAS